MGPLAVELLSSWRSMAESLEVASEQHSLVGEAALKLALRSGDESSEQRERVWQGLESIEWLWGLGEGEGQRESAVGDT